MQNPLKAHEPGGGIKRQLTRLLHSYVRTTGVVAGLLATLGIVKVQYQPRPIGNEIRLLSHGQTRNLSYAHMPR